MRAGKLRHRVTFQTQTKTRDSEGGIVYTWADDFSLWAEIKPVSGNEKIKSDRFINETTHQIAIRFYDGVTTKQRIIYGSRTFEILNILNVYERDREMILECKENV